jgi:hypothetical protein
MVVRSQSTSSVVVMVESKKRAHGGGRAEAEREKKRRKLDPPKGAGDAKNAERRMEKEGKRKKAHEVGKGEGEEDSEEVGERRIK